MVPSDDAAQVLKSAREGLALPPEAIDRAETRFLGRLEVEAQRGGWRNRFELGPIVLTWLRLFVLGSATLVVIAFLWSRCSPYEQQEPAQSAPQ
jgi:hypothetical protein